MQIAFLGDVHGCVRHAAAVINSLGVDLAIQVGDLGAYRSYAELPAGDRAFIDANPAQGDFFRLLDGSLALDAAVPILFLTGNHDDAGWLGSLHDHDDVVHVVAGLDLFHVACGGIVELDGLRFGFLGDVEEPESGHDIDMTAAERLADIDVLVTHDGPYGLATWQGRTQGSAKLVGLINELRPRLHVHGHYHHRNGPRRYGPTRSYGLAQLLPPLNDNPHQSIGEGSVGVLDTTTHVFSYVTEERTAKVRVG